MWKVIALVIIGIVEAIWLLKLDKFTIKKYKKYTNLAIMYLISLIITFILLRRIDFIEQVIQESANPIVENFILILISIAISLLFSPIYVAFMQKRYEKKLIKESEKNIEVQEYHYYREIIKNISPAMLAYSYNQKINVEDTIVATLLYLQLNGYIKIEENEINVLQDINELLPHEKLIIENFTNKKYDEKSFGKKLKYTLKNDMISKKYITTEKEDDANITYFMEMIFAWLIIYILSTLLIFIASSSIGIYLFVFYFLVFLSLPLYKFIQKKINVVIKSKEMLELCAKMAGVRNYIKDYSNISTSSINMINLYEEFVIYAIILDIKGQLDDECSEMYKRIKNMYYK